MSKGLSLPLQQAAAEIDLDLIEGGQYRKLDMFPLTKEGCPFVSTYQNSNHLLFFYVVILIC